MEDHLHICGDGICEILDVADDGGHIGRGLLNKKDEKAEQPREMQSRDDNPFGLNSARPMFWERAWGSFRKRTAFLESSGQH
jgi:hypothetical protein